MERPTNTRWRLTKAILWLSTVAFFIPQLINWFAQFFEVEGFYYEDFALIGSGEWVTLILSVIGMYQIANVARDHKSFNNNITEKDLEEAGNVEPVVEDEGD